MGVAVESTVLSSWKDIARYLGKGVRTVQRWERHLGLPVRRPFGSSRKSAVLLHREDVDAWLATRFTERTVEIALPDHVRDASLSARAELKKKLETARALRDKHFALTQQIAESIRLLSEQCAEVSAHRTKSQWRPAVYAESSLANSGFVTTRGTEVTERIG